MEEFGMTKNKLRRDQKNLTETIFSSDQKVCLEEKILHIFHSSKNTL